MTSAPLRLLLDPDTRIVAVDGQLATALGHDTAHLLLAHFSGLLHPDEVAEVGADLVNLVRGRVPSVTSRRSLRRADGSVGGAVLSLAARRTDDGELDGFDVAVMLDDDLRAPVVLPEHLRRLGTAAAVIDASGRLADTNAAWGRLFATPEAVTPGSHLSELTLDTDRDQLIEQLERLRTEPEATLRTDLRCASHNGALWCRFSIAPLDLARTSFTVTAEDVSAELVTNRVLAANEALFRSLTEQSPVGMARLTPDLTIAYANRAWGQLTDSAGDSASISLSELVHPDDRDQVLDDVARNLDNGSSSQVRCRLATAPDRRIGLRFSPVHDDDLGVVGHVVTAEDITSVRSGGSAPPPFGIIESTSDLVAMADLSDGRIEYLNQAALDQLGHTADTKLFVRDLFEEAQRLRYRNDIEPVLRRGETWSGEVTAMRSDGSPLPLLLTVAGQVDDNGEVQRAAVLASAVSTQRRLQDELTYRATHDLLTGLPNRGLLLDHLDLALARSSRDQVPVGLLFIDLDRFKAVNDTLGHEAGDMLLREIARRMSDVLRPSDTVARLGGDEFVVLCEDIGGERDALTIADRIQRAMVDEPLLVHGTPVDVTTSIGVAIATGTTRDATTLLAHADAAMYRAKHAGRARVELYDDVLRDQSQRRRELTDQLEQALDTQALEVHYQPIVDLHSGRIAAVEALVRWLHPTRGMLEPAEFLAIAADSGLAERLDRLVLERACADAARWQQTVGDSAPTVHVNVTGRTALSGVLTEIVTTALATSELDAARLCIELSERSLMSENHQAAQRLASLKALGVKLAIDDVGTGATSLPLLKSFDLDVLKVDAALTSDLSGDPAAERLVAAAIALGRALGLTVAVEGIEQRESISVLRELGAQLAQGRVFSDPLPAARIEPLFPLRSSLARRG